MDIPVEVNKYYNTVTIKLNLPFFSTIFNGQSIWSLYSSINTCDVPYHFLFLSLASPSPLMHYLTLCPLKYLSLSPLSYLSCLKMTGVQCKLWVVAQVGMIMTEMMMTTSFPSKILICIKEGTSLISYSHWFPHISHFHLFFTHPFFTTHPTPSFSSLSPVLPSQLLKFKLFSPVFGG